MDGISTEAEITIIHQSSQISNKRLKELLETPSPNSGNQYDGEDEDDGDDDKEFLNLMEADLYNSAKQDEELAFLDVLERVSKKKKMTVSDIFKMVSLSGDTLLHVAASNGNAIIVDLIINHFHSLLNKENYKGDTAVHVAAKAGEVSLSVLQVINSKRNEFSNLRSSIYCGLANDKVPWTDASLKAKNEQGNTPLHEALINGHEILGVKLLEQDGSVSFFLNEDRKSAFYLAAEAGYIKCLELMMKYGSIDQYREGKSPIHAAILGKHTGALHIMLEKVPRLINLKDEEGRTPLHFAAWMGYNDVVSYLIGKNSRNVIKRDKDGQLPIHSASMNGHINVIKQLLRKHYNPHELYNGNGQNILHVAAASGQYNVVNYIIKHHKELYKQLLNEKDHEGNMPLHLATMSFHPKIVSALTWDDRANLLATNNNDMTVLDAALDLTNEIPTFRQRLTWSTLIASGAPQNLSGKILLNAGLRSKPKPVNTDKNTFGKEKTYNHDNSDKPSQVDPKQPNIDSFKDRVNTLLLVSTLIVTVTYAAGFTMPGGINDSDPDVGIATMIRHRMFHLFVFCDTIAMFTSLVVAVTLIWAQLGDIHFIDTALNLAVPLLGFALTLMSLAFMAGIYLTVGVLNWLSLAILIVALIFTIVVVLLFFPLVFPDTSRETFLFQFVNTTEVEDRWAGLILQIDVQRTCRASRRRAYPKFSLPYELSLILNGDNTTPVAEDSGGSIQANPSSLNQEVHMAKSMDADIYRAVTTGDIDAFKQAMEDRDGLPLMDQVTPKGNTVLHLAAMSGYDHLVELIITQCTDLLWLMNSMDNNALHGTANAGNLSTVIVSAPNFHLRPLSWENRDGNNPLYMAIKSCRKEVAMFLVESYLDKSCNSNEEHKSPLYMAAEAGYLELVKVMIEKQRGGIVTKEPVFRLRIKSLVHAAITGKKHR